MSKLHGWTIANKLKAVKTTNINERATGQEPPVAGRSSAIGGRPLAIGDQRAAIGGRQSAVSSRRSWFVARRLFARLLLPLARRSEEVGGYIVWLVVGNLPPAPLFFPICIRQGINECFSSCIIECDKGCGLVSPQVDEFAIEGRWAYV